jgi:hypothetical protein
MLWNVFGMCRGRWVEIGETGKSGGVVVSSPCLKSRGTKIVKGQERTGRRII